MNDFIFQLITLSVVSLSGAHYTVPFLYYKINPFKITQICLPIDLHGPAIVTKVRVVALNEQGVQNPS
jgi:hypothetical protein